MRLFKLREFSPAYSLDTKEIGVIRLPKDPVPGYSYISFQNKWYLVQYESISSESLDITLYISLKI